MSLGKSSVSRATTVGLISLLVTIGLSAPTAGRAQAGTHEAIADFLIDKQAEFGIVGYSVVVLQDGGRIHASSAGFANLEHDVPVSSETVFQVFSVAKLFVNVTVMQLVESGQVDLNAAIGTYVSDLPPRWQSIPVNALLSHTSGLPEYYQWPNPTPPSAEAALASVWDRPFEFETGTATQYNQTNYLLLRQLIETVTGESFLTVMRARMMEPVGFTQTQYAGEFAVVRDRATMYRASPQGVLRNIFIDQPDYMFASTGLNTTAADFTLWMEKLLAGQLLDEASMSAMWTPVELIDGRIAGFANGWEYYATEDMTVWGHGGGNRADVRHFISGDQTVTVVFLTNGSEVDYWPGSISYGIARLVFGEGTSGDPQ